MKKHEVLAMLEQFPEDFEPERLIDELYLRAKLERAEEAIARGDVVSHEEVVARSRKWFEPTILRASQSTP